MPFSLALSPLRRDLTPRGLKARLRRLSAHLPEGLDPWATRAEELVHKARGLAALHRWVSSVHEGPLPHGGPIVRVAYLGRAQLEGDALLAFRGPEGASAFRREVLDEGGFRALARARRNPCALREGSADVCLVDPLFAWSGGLRGAFRYPVFLRAVLPLGGSFDEQLLRVRSKPYRRVLRRARKQAAPWRVSRDEDNLRDFYDNLYVPLAKARFGEGASVSPYARLASTLRERGELLLVEHERAFVIGALLYRSPGARGTLFNWKYGVRSPWTLDGATLRGLTASLEVALLEHALARGDARVDFGLTPAVANEGVFVHKRRLGCDFTPLPRGPELFLRFSPGAEARVLERAPLFVRDGGGLRCLVGFTGLRDAKGEALATAVLREHTFAGCERATLFVAEAAGAVDDILPTPRPRVDVMRREEPASASAWSPRDTTAVPAAV